MIPWQRCGPGLAHSGIDHKLLSRDAQDGACSLLTRYPRGWAHSGLEHISAAEEFYILDGTLYMDDQAYPADSYAYLPAGWTRNTIRTPDGCVLLAFYDRKPVLQAGAGVIAPEDAYRATPYLDAAAMPWDMTLNDTNLRHLGIGRKNLRTDPQTGERTFLSLIMPQSAPPTGEGPQEIHPIVEEAYLISGSITGPHGTMHSGGYFWRPPNIAHGPFGARWGAVSLIRFLGGRHVNIWTAEHAAFDFDVPYSPILSEELRRRSDLHWSPPPAY